MLCSQRIAGRSFFRVVFFAEDTPTDTTQLVCTVAGTPGTWVEPASVTTDTTQPPS